MLWIEGDACVAPTKLCHLRYVARCRGGVPPRPYTPVQCCAARDQRSLAADTAASNFKPSTASCSVNTSGASTCGSTPSLLMVEAGAGSFTPAANDRASFSMISLGVRAGAMNPFQLGSTVLGWNSPMVGTSG